MSPSNLRLKLKLEPRVEPPVQPDTGVAVSSPAQEVPTQEKTPVPPPAQKSASKSSAAKNVLNRSWDFTQTLLKRLPDIVDENPVKVVLGLVKLVAEIKDVSRCPEPSVSVR